MSSWKRVFSQLGYSVEGHFDTLRLRLKERLGSFGPVQILPYRGYGTNSVLHIKGRVVEDRGIRRATDNSTLWDNLVATYRRFESVEIPNVRVRAEYGDSTREAFTDMEGYFAIELPCDVPLSTEGIWQPIRLHLLDNPHSGQAPVDAFSECLVPNAMTRFGVISDIDDTIMETHATSLAKMAKITFLNNARTRLPFTGVAAFYRALQEEGGNLAQNPLFYVSRSPWNLYDLIEDFMGVHGIPKGPLFLRDFSMEHERSRRGGRRFDYKLRSIETLLHTYPDLPFILIGDSGQNDPEIYQQVVHDFPGRILAVYIRDVSTGRRDPELRAIGVRLAENGVELVVSDNTKAAALHALRNGWILPEALPAIREESSKGEAQTDSIARMIEEDEAGLPPPSTMEPE